MSHIEQDFAARIREQGYRLTPQRQLILDAICEADGAATLNDIYERTRQKAPAINQTTVYRALKFFRDLQLVVTTEIEGRTVYEIASAQSHHHLVCQACGAAWVLDDTLFDDLGADLLDAYGFHADIRHLTITGLCAQCQTSK